MSLAVRYVAFAVIAALVNFTAQELVLRAKPPAALALSILVGTAAGFVVKYVLDKKWIFFDTFTSHRGEAKKIVLYGLFSVLMTLVFWSFELAFLALWQTDFAKYAGGAVGLSVGYIWKFALDRRYVFKLQEV